MVCINGIDTIEVLSEDGSTSKVFQELLDNNKGDIDKAYAEYLNSDEVKSKVLASPTIDEVIPKVEVDTEKVDRINEIVKNQMKVLSKRAKDLERTLNSLGTEDRTKRQDTINRIKRLEDSIKDKEYDESFTNLVSYAKKELEANLRWLKDGFNVDNISHRDTLYALSKQLDNYAGLVVPYLAIDNPSLQSDILGINDIYDRIKRLIPRRMEDILVDEIEKRSTNKIFNTREDIVDYLRSGEDIDLAQSLVIDASSSTNTVIAIVDKIFKEKIEEIHDETHKLKEEALAAGKKLLDAGYENQDFMIDKSTGNIITRTSSDWKTAKDEVLDILNSSEVDENGRKIRRQYITKPVDELTDEDLAHNIELAKDKSVVGKFLRAEQWVKGKLLDGSNNRYTELFKSARDVHEYYNGDTRTWEKRDGISKSQYEKYRRKYYKDGVETYVADRDENGEHTGTLTLTTLYWPKDDYIETTDKWNSKEYDAIQSNDAQREFYKFYTTKFKEIMNKLPSDVGKKMDGRVFRIKDEFLHDLSKKEGSIIKRVLGYLKQLFLPDIITNGRQLDENGYPINDVGIFYVGDLKNKDRITKLENEIAVTTDPTKLAKLKNSLLIENNKLEASQLQYDLVKSLVQGGHMAENYATMKSVESTFLTARELLANRQYYKTDKLGNPMMDSEGNIEYKDEESRALKRLDTYMRMIYYNNSTANNNAAGKIAAMFKRYVSIKLQGFNLFSGINNIVTAEVNQIIEAKGRRFYNEEQYKKASGIMVSHIAEMKWISNMFKQVDKYTAEKPYNKLTAMVEKFNFLEENSDRDGGIKQKETVGEYVKSFNWMFAFIEGGEYQAQVKSAIAKMMNTEVELSDGSKTNVWDAYDFDKESGKLLLKDGVKFSPKNRIEVTGQIKNMNKYIHGNHSSIDKVALQETWYGELAMQFKRWMPNNFRSRFSDTYMDESLNMEMEGRYRAFIPFIKNIQSVGLDYKKAMEGLSDIHKANMRKNITEIAMLGIAIALYIIFDSIRDRIPPEDEKLRAALNFLKKQADRSRGEITVFISPLAWYEQAKNPVAGLRILQDVGEFLAQLASIPIHLIGGDSEKLRYEKGVNKGELKAVKEGRDLIPGIQTINQWRQLNVSGNFFIK